MAVLFYVCLYSVVTKIAVNALPVPLKDGLCSVNEIYTKLIEAQVDPLTGKCSSYDDIRNLIVLAKQKLEQSDQAASTELMSLDTSIENLEKDEGRLEQERIAIQCSLENLKTEETSNEESVRQSKSALEQARIDLDAARDTLQSQEERKRKAEIVTGVGGGLFLFPGIGWVVGSIMVTTGGVELHRSIQAVRSAEEEVRNFESQVENYRGKVYEYKDKITQAEQNITQKEDQAVKMRKEIQNVKEQREAVAELQMKLRKILGHILGLLSGRASVVEGHTCKFIEQEPVMKVMEDLLNAAEEMFKNQLPAICALSSSEEVY